MTDELHARLIALAAYLDALAEQARQKATQQPDREQMAYWQGCSFGLETAAAEVRKVRMASQRDWEED